MPYTIPHLYDIAFNWRDVRAECDFMLGRFQAARGRLPTSAVELACGPGRHARTLAAQGIRTVGVDSSVEMITYAQAQPGGDDRDVAWLAADMRDFTLDEPVELACCLMDSLSHLLTLDDLLAHLDAVARNATPDALYVIEQSHPRDFLGDEPGATPLWSAEDESGETTVHVRWGEEADQFDPVTQIAPLTVTLRAERGGETVAEITEIVPSRLWLAGEMEAAIRASGRWQLRERFGAMDATIPWQSDPPAWRMVSILTRTPVSAARTTEGDRRV